MYIYPEMITNAISNPNDPNPAYHQPDGHWSEIIAALSL
jgi:hypothetical protein